MKKLFLCFAAVAAIFSLSAQTFVSTEPSNKNVILEEYTGVNCGYCPDGHKIANEIAADNPGRFFAINIHQGSYANANPNFTTQWGDALAGQTGLTGYPSGTINRHVFSGSNTALSRNTWEGNSNTILGQASPVNVAARATINHANGLVSMEVEVYYTANSTASTNALNVAVLQDNILGPQSGGSSFNPGQMENGQYIHMHMLRDLITGQWGETITNTQTGAFHTFTYDFYIPAAYNGIPVNINDINFLVFIAEGNQEIITGTDVEITRTLSEVGGGISGELDDIEGDYCSDEIGAEVKAFVANWGTSTIQSLEIEYTADDEAPQTYSWTGNIDAGELEEIDIPAITLSTSNEHTISLNIASINGVAVESGVNEVSIPKGKFATGGNLTFKLKTDNYGSETTFEIKNSSGVVVLEGGPFADNASIEHVFSFEPEEIGCYILTVYDQYEDGINGGYGSGYFEMVDANGNVIFHNDGTFGDEAVYTMDITEVSSVEGYTAENMKVYPNPANNQINISAEHNITNVTVVNVVGQVISNENINTNFHTVNVSSLTNGIYFVKATINNEVVTQKVVVQ